MWSCTEDKPQIARIEWIIGVLMKSGWPIAIAVFLVCVSVTYLPALSGHVPFPRDLLLRHAVWDSVRQQAPQRGPEVADLIALIYPFHAFAAREVRAGTLPLWNPYISSGAAFQASPPSALFYPLNWIYFFLPAPWAWTTALALRMFLAAVFMALLIRALGGSLAGCIVAGIVFAACGFMTAWQGQVIGDSAIWLPMICYSVHRLYRDRSMTSVALTSLSFAMPVLAGHPETAAHSALVGCAFALVFADKRFIARFALAGVLAAGLASVQILPTLEWLGELKQDLNTPEPALSRHDGQGFFSRDISTSPSSALVPIPEGASYAGMLSLLMLPFAFFHRPRRFVWFFIVITVVAAAVAFSVQPVHWIVEHLPLIRAWKNGRLILVADFGIAALAGFGITVLERELPSRKRGWILSGLASAIALAGIYEVHLATQTAAPFLRRPAGSLIFLSAALALVALRISRHLNASNFQTLVCGLAAVEMISFSYGFLGFAKTVEIFPRAPLFDFLKKQGPPGTFRIAKGGYPIPANSGMMYGFEMAEGYDLTTARARLFTDGLREERDDAVFFRIDQVVASPDRRFDLLNVRYVVVPYPGQEFDLLSSRPDRFRIVYREPSLAVFENSSVLPRVFAVPSSGVEVVVDPPRQLSRVKEAGFDPLSNVVMSQPAREVGKTGEPLSAKLDVLDFSINGTKLNTQTSAPSLLVFSQIAYPGWHATVDGRETHVVSADFAFPGIELPAGNHEVLFVFAPRLLRIGAAISMLSIIVIVALFLELPRITRIARM
jgi:hypothetical protein